MTDRKAGIAAINPTIIWALQPFADYSRRSASGRFLDGSIIIEPCAYGGAIVVGICDHAMAVIRDPIGECSGPMTVAIPDGLFAACAPREPVQFDYCGHLYACDLPEWAQPGTLWLYNAGCHLLPKMRHPDWAREDREFQPCLWSQVECGKVCRLGHDYKWTDGAKIDWRHPLRLALQRSEPVKGPHCFAPEVAALFTRLHHLLLDSPTVGRARMFHRLSAEGVVLVTADKNPDFVGTYMQMLEGAYAEPPEWFEARVHDQVGTA